MPFRKKRILFLIHSLSMGGAERVTSNLANYWVGKGYTVIVSTLQSKATDFYTLDSRIDRIALDLARNSKSIISAVFNNLRIILAVRRLLQQRQPEVIISFMSSANIYLAISSIGLPGYKIGSERIHPPMLPLGRSWEILRRLTYGRLDHLVALTEPSAAWLKKNIKTKRVTVIGNPITLPLPIYEPLRIPNSLLSSERKYILAVGRLVQQKRFDLLIEAFSRLAMKMPNWDLVIIGEGPLNLTLESQIEKTGLNDRVFLVGKTGNLEDWYKAADIYALSSHFEGFPNTLLEAMAHGLPAVSFDCDTGPRDIIRHEVDGLLVNNGNIVALAESLHKLMSNDNLRQEFGLKAIEVRERFSMDNIARMWESLFSELNS